MSLIKSNGGGLGGSGSPGGALGTFYGHTIDQSLRFEDGDSPSLSKTYSTAQTNTKIITVSVWVKRANLGIRTTILYAKSGSSGWFIFNTDDKLYWNPFNTGYNAFISTRVFRDPSAWYHIVATADSENQSGANIYNVYVNGEQLTNSDGSSHVPDDTATKILANGITTYIGDDTDGDYHFDGYLAEMHVIDGSVVAHTEFGETKDGVWVPKAYNGSHGNNGFYLPFSQDRTVSASAFFDESDNSYVSFSNSSLYDIGSSDDFTLEFFFWPTVGEVSGNSNMLGYYGGTSGPYFMVSTDLSSRNFQLYYGNGQAYTFGAAASGSINAGRWHHVAVNRASGTLELFLDGTRVGSSQVSNTQDWDTTQFRINKAHNSSNTTFDGYISNVRLVIGSSVYSAGSSITVPTSPLTDITNTKLLACTTTTITQDASSNNVTGTANGTAGSGYYATDGISPFPNAAFNEDASGNSNDFSANNLLDTDVVPDSPTNNFATMNPIYHSALKATLLEGNLKVDTAGFNNSANNYGAVSTFAIPKDKKIYLEVECTDGVGSNWYAGFATKSGLESGTSSTNVGGASAVTLYNRAVMKNGTQFQYSSSSGLGGLGGGINPLQAGDILGMAVDGSNGNVWFHKNGSYFHTILANNGSTGPTGDPSANSDPVATIDNVPDEDLFVVIGGNTSVSSIFVNFGQDSVNVSSANSDSNGIGTFEYAVPTDYVCLCSSNLSDLTIGPGQSSQADEHFNTALWSGNSTNNRSITTDHATDFVWIKKRTTTVQSHVIADSVRGTSNNGGTGNVRILSANSAAVESTNQSDSGIASFDSDGFTLGAGSNTANADAPYQGINASGHTYVGWSWKAGGAPTADNSAGVGATPTAGSVKIDGSNLGSALAGSIAATRLSANTKAGFSIIEWVGNQTNSTLAHGLNSTPEMVIVKNLDYGSANWYTWHKDINTDKVLFLNATNSETTSANAFVEGNMAATTIGLGTERVTNGSSEEMLAFVWHSVEGYSRIGSYLPSSASDSYFVYCGFRPAWVMIKRTTGATRSWAIYDNKRGTFNEITNPLAADLTSTEPFSTAQDIDFVSNGFNLPADASTHTVAASVRFIFMAFAEDPFKFANAR